tara:strand:+ start:221 stop:760 length:540 start_codon:yes stop_codon:yes gene_type:complete
MQTELVATDQYEDQQFQNPAPIGPQDPIPPGVHDIELSWDRKKGWMRIIIDGKTWYFKEFLGRCQIVSTDNNRGRINIRAVAVLNGETLTMHRDPNAGPHKVIDGVVRPKTHNRLCYRRMRQDWRLRDEHTGDLVFCNGYVGDMNCEWLAQDTVGHIYHNGWTTIDENGLAHLYDPLVR